MKRIKAIIFDCDGVMFDSRQANINYYNHILQNFHLSPMTEDQIIFVHMHTADESIKHIFKGTDLVEKAMEYRRQMNYTLFIKDMVIERELKELLISLKPQYGLAIATNRSDTIGEVLKLHDLEVYFDIVVSSLDVQHPKPHPESIFKILSFFKIRPDQAVYIGDSLVDWQAAGAAGVKLVAYQNEILETPWKVKNLLAIKELLKRFERA